MKIKVTETFSHETGCHTKGSVRVVSDELGAEVIAAGLAVEVVEEKPKAPKPPQKSEAK